MRTTQRKGDTAVAKAIHSFTEMGYDIGVLVTESASYDLFVDIAGDVKRVQVKFCTTGKEVQLRNVSHNTKGRIMRSAKVDAYDWLYILTGNGTEYLFTECLVGRSTVSPRKEHELKTVLSPC